MQQQKHNADGTTAMLLLLDTPDLWLTQLLSGQYLDCDSELSLFQTCKKFNEMVMQKNKSTSLRIDPLARQRNRVLNMLQTATRHAPSIKLSLHHKCDRGISWEDKQKAAEQMMQIACSILQEAAEQGATAAIKELQLEGTKLETVLPPVIGQACPNLHMLILYECTVGLDKTISVSQHFRNLRALELHECDCDAAYCGLQEACCRNNADKQGLTALSGMTIVPRCSEFDGEIAIINSLAAPLTHLCINTRYIANEESVECNLSGMDWVQLGATLQNLQLHGLQGSNDAMEIFLNMPRLTYVLVQEFHLQKSFSGRSCNWEELVIESCVDAQTLAYLPLHPGLELKLGENGAGGACGLYMKEHTYDLLPQAVSNVQRARALEWVERRASLSQYLMEASELAKWLSRALPLIKDVKNLEIEGGNLNGAAMQALYEFVHGREDAPSVSFGSDTQWVVEDMANLVAHMPCNCILSVSFDGPDAEQQVVQLCCAAKQKVSLQAYCKGASVTEGEEHLCEQRIRSAIQANDIEVLSLSCEPCIYSIAVNITVQPRHVGLS